MSKYKINIENTILALKKIIENEIEDKYLKSAVIEFLYQTKLEVNDSEPKFTLYLKIISFLYFINSLSSVKLSYLDWDFLCYVYNNFDLFIDLKHFLNKENYDIIIEKAIYSFNKNVKHTGKKNFVNFIIDFYKYIYETKKYHKFSNVVEIEKYYNLLISFSKVRTLYIKVNDKDFLEFFLKNIHSDFPINSKYTNMITVKTNFQKNLNQLNYNINTDNEFLKNIFYEFFQVYIHLIGNNLKDIRIFLYYFVDSCNGQVPSSLIDFDDNLLKKQINFYKDFYSKHKDFYSRQNAIIILHNFYKFLVNKSNKSNESIGLSQVLCDALEIKNFIRFYLDGYEFTYYNQFDNPPLSDKVCLLPSLQSMNNSAINNSTAFYYDVSDYDAKYKNDVKTFIHNVDGYLPSIINYLPKLKEFFEIKQIFDKEYFSINTLDKDSYIEFDDEFLYFYRSSIELKYTNSASLKAVLKIVRKYLKFFKDKYNLKKIHFDILNLKKLEKHNNRTIITNHDINIIYNAFENKEKDLDIGRLYTIVFEIFIHTNLRIGSILNLTRDCLEYNNDGTVTLSYLSKTSNKEYIKQLVSPTIVKILEEALKITNPFIENLNDDKLSNYIFVHKYMSKHRYNLKRLSFYSYFRKIINSVDKELDFHDYCPYNIRHTYMNNVFKNGAKIGLNINDLTAIAGISYKTANLYYRDFKDNIDLYVEALSKVKFNNVTINGEILSSNSDISDNKPVKNNLGNCKSNKCIFEDGECLYCNNFVTFTNRIPDFEKAILNCDKKINKTDNPLVKDFYTTQKKLLAAYLAQMLKLKK